MALTDSQRAAYETLVAQGRQEFADQFAAAMTAVNAGVPVQQATQAAMASNPQAASYFSANPDVAAAYVQNSYGLTPEQFAQTHYERYGASEGRAAPVSVPTQSTQTAPTNFVNPLNNLGTVNNTALATGLSGGDTSIPGVTNTLENLTSQIQRINTALDNKNWTGSWRGDSNSAVNAAAEILSSKGVSDLSNLTVVPTEIQQNVWDENGSVAATYTVPGFNLVDRNTGQVVSTSQTKDFTLDTYDTGNIFKSNDKSFGITVTEEGVPVPYRTTEKGGIGKTALAFGATVLGAPYVSGLLASTAPATFAAGTAANAAATGAILGGGSAAITGNDILKGALLGGLGGYASNALSGAMTPTDLGMNSQLTPAAIESGLGTPGYGYNAAAAASGLFNPALIGAGAYQDFPASSLAPDNIDIGGGWSPNLPDYEMTITASRPEPVFDSSGLPIADYSNEGRNYSSPSMTQGLGGSPSNATSVPSNVNLKNIVDAVKLGSLVVGAAGGANAISQGPTGFPIVPVPSDWRTPTYGQTGAWPALRPIDFGSRELLRGTQWEQYLNPQEAVVAPAPQFSMDFDTLMNSLNGGQAGSLTLNDIISGIQSQYGQTNPGTVG